MANYTYSDDADSAVKNKLGARTHDELEQREGKYVFARTAEIAAGHGPKGTFDASHLKAIHHHLFQDVYEWAGHTRDEKVQLSDGTVATEPVMRKVDGQPFMAGPAIPKALDRIGDDIRAARYLRDLPREEFAAKTADIMADINAIHPFREGNGRTQRVFVGELATQAGHELDFTVVSRERMIQASIAANEHGDPEMMRRLFVEISDPARVAALDKAERNLDQLDFPWNDRYVATAEPGHKVELIMAGVAGDQFIGRTAATIIVGQTRDLPDPPPARQERFVLEPSAWQEPEPSRLADKQRSPAGQQDPPDAEKQAKLDRLNQTHQSRADHDNDGSHGRGGRGGRGADGNERRGAWASPLNSVTFASVHTCKCAYHHK